MPYTYGGAVSVNAKTVVNKSTDLSGQAGSGVGGASAGINFGLNNVSGSAAGTDEASVGASPIGGAPGTTVTVESGDGVGV